MRRSVMCMAVFLAAAHMGWAAETAPDPAAFPRMIFLHNMWWSGPGSPRFIPGGAAVSESPHAAAASGHYENAPLIPPAARDAAGNALSHEDGRRVQVFRDARMAGIDAVIYDCFSDRVNTYIALFRVAEAARLSGSGVRVCPCADRMPGDGLDFLKNLWEYRDPDSGRLLREHPNLLRTGGRPIVFEYHKAGAGVWAERLQRMQAAGGDARVVAHAADGINSAVQGRLSPAVRDYIAFAPAAYLFASHARAFGNPDPTDALGALVRTFDPPKAFGGPVAPGYVGTTRVGNLLDPRGTWLYRLQWTSRIRGNPDFVHLTTGNDYSETEQECSANSTFTFMDLTRYFGTRWRTGAWPEPDGPQAFLSYRTTVARRERAEFELVLLRPELTGDETEAGTAGRFEAECRVHTSWGETVALPPAAPRAALGHVVWRFRLEAGFDGAGWGRPEVSLRVDGEPVALPDGPAAGFGVMDDGEELARKWLRVPLHRIRAGVRARLIVSGSPDNLYPRTVRVEGLPWDDVAGGVLMRNGLTSLWYTLTPDVLRNGFVERFYAGPGFAPVHYEDGWKKRRVQDRTDRYTGAVRLADGGVVYPAPAVLDAPRVDPATVMDPMIPPPLDRLGPPLSPTLLKLWGPDADRLADRGPLGHDLRLPPEGDPARPRVLRDGPDGPWYLRFDGDDDRVPAAPGGNRPLNMPPGPLTVELRLRCRAAGRPQVIFDQWGDAMGIGLTGAGRLVIARLNRERTMDWLEGRQPLEPERWYTVHAVYDGRELKLYVDGEADGAPVASDGLRTDENMVLGGTSGILAVLAGMHERIGGHFAGDLARLRVLQRPLSAEEIRRAAGPRP